MIKTFTIAAAIAAAVVMSAQAAEPGKILARQIQGETAVLYIQSPGESSISAQVGTIKCEPVTVETEPEIHTLFLIDNSLSIQEKYRSKINSLATDIAAGKAPQEKISVATFAEDLNYLVRDSSDYTEIKRAIDSIQYRNQNSYLTPILYGLFKEWEKENEEIFHRVIVISDGASEEAIGYTMSELTDLIRSAPYPVISFGCSHKNGKNKEDLENLFSISRKTSAGYWLMDDVKDPLETAAAIAAENDIQKVSVGLPSEVCDGTEKGLLLNIESGYGQIQSSTTLRMPFGAIRETETETQEETEAETEPTTEAQTETTAELILPPVQEPKKESSRLPLFILIAAAAAAVIGAAVVILKKKKKPQPKPQGVGPKPVPPVDNDETMPVNGEGNGNTVSAFSDEVRTLILTDLNRPEISYEVPIRGKVILGRSNKGDCNIVIDDPTRSVSHVHCHFKAMNGNIYVTDVGSFNGTIVDGQKIFKETLLKTNSILKLGNVVLRVDIK